MNGWKLAGTHPGQYAHGIRARDTFEGKRVAQLRCVAPAADGFGTLMQMIAADEYRGRRVRFSGAVRASQVADWAGLWMRVDGPVKGTPLAFDNMQGRPIKGTTAWQRYDVILDVAEHAQAIGFGVLLVGKGALRVADFAFDVVPPAVPVTAAEPLPRHPRNMDLSEP